MQINDSSEMNYFICETIHELNNASKWTKYLYLIFKSLEKSWSSKKTIFSKKSHKLWCAPARKKVV